MHKRDGYDYSKVVYIDAKTEVIIGCPIHGDFTQTPDQHRRSGCPACSGKHNINTFNIDLKRYDSCSYCVEFTNMTSSAVFECKKRGRFEGVPSRFRKDYLCPICRKERAKVKKQHRDFTRFKQQAPDGFEYKNFTGGKVTITCVKHGERIVKTNNVRCDLCAEELRIQKSVDDFIARARSAHGDLYDYSLITTTSGKVPIICKKHGVFYTLPQNHISTHNQCGCPSCSTYVSNAEYEILEFLNQHQVDCIQSDRKTIHPYELDIYIPKYNLAIEYDGMFWHSSGDTQTDKEASIRHARKTDLCNKQGIQLLHVFEHEWNTKKDIWKRMMLSKLGKLPTVYARKCTIKEIDTSTAKEFINRNHIQGYCKSSVKIGLFSESNELLMVATFGRSRFNNCDWELYRLASSTIAVVGGASRLIAYFKRRHIGQLVSFANKRWSIGNVYAKIGFEYVNDTAPCYWYWKGHELSHRSMYMKHKLTNLPAYHPDKTEIEIMYESGYRRIWDSGHQQWVLT